MGDMGSPRNNAPQRVLSSHRTRTSQVVNTVLVSDEEAASWLAEPRRGLKPDDLRHQKSLGLTAMHIACREAHLGMAIWLSNHGAMDDVRTPTQTGQTCLHIASQKKCLPIIRWLLDHGRADATAENDEGNTPFHFAAMTGSVAALELLWTSHTTTTSSMSLVSAVRRADHRGDRPVWWASDGGHMDACLWLLEKGGLGHDNDNDLPDLQEQGDNGISWVAASGGGGGGSDGQDARIEDDADAALVEPSAVQHSFRERGYGDFPAMRRKLHRICEAEVQAHASFVGTVLWGCSERSNSGGASPHPLSSLQGLAGVKEKLADLLGVQRGRLLRAMRLFAECGEGEEDDE
jgi:hypothetical protein